MLLNAARLEPDFGSCARRLFTEQIFNQRFGCCLMPSAASNDNRPGLPHQSRLPRLKIVEFHANSRAFGIFEGNLVVRNNCARQTFFGKIRHPFAACCVTPFEGNCQIGIFTAHAKEGSPLNGKTRFNQKQARVRQRTPDVFLFVERLFVHNKSGMTKLIFLRADSFIPQTSSPRWLSCGRRIRRSC